jgi:hypothetical protein
VQWARRWAGARPVVYVAGNHEFYGQAHPGLIADLRRAAAGSSVHVLEDDEVIVDGVRFLGCTLWSDFDFDGPEHREVSMRISQRAVNDYSQIMFNGGGRTLSAADTREAHLQSRQWLEERLARPFDGATVVVTHHAPLIRTRPSAALWRALAGAFVSDLTDLMGADRMALWIFGHTHRWADVDVRGTRVVSNPRGYPHEPVAQFDPGLVVDV